MFSKVILISWWYSTFFPRPAGDRRGDRRRATEAAAQLRGLRRRRATDLRRVRRPRRRNSLRHWTVNCEVTSCCQVWPAGYRCDQVVNGVNSCYPLVPEVATNGPAWVCWHWLQCVSVKLSENFSSFSPRRSDSKLQAAGLTSNLNIWISIKSLHSLSVFFEINGLCHVINARSFLILIPRCSGITMVKRKTWDMSCSVMP